MKSILPKFLSASCAAGTVLLLWVSIAAAQRELSCGIPITGILQPGAIDEYSISALPGTQILVEATDAAQQIGLLRLKETQGQSDETCSGSLRFASPQDGARIEVSDCLGNMSGEYTLSAVVVSEGPENCATPLPCGSTPDGTTFARPGEVDSYSFVGASGDVVKLEARDFGGTIGAVRLRVFDPSGRPLSGTDTCAESITLTLPRSGQYTLLASACARPRTGYYRLTFERPSCPSGPHLTYFGVARADDIALPPEGFDPEGRPIFSRPLGQGFEIIVEARSGPGRRPVGRQAFVFDLSNPVAFPDLQLLVSRPLGLGTAEVCDAMLPAIGGVPASPELEFVANAGTANAINDLGCRVNDGQGNPQARVVPSDSCTRDSSSGEFHFVDPQSTTQFCLPVARSWAFPPGDTIVKARLRDEAGEVGESREIVIRVGGTLPFEIADVTPNQLTELRGFLFFTANDGVHGTELWRSDGSSEGTQAVADLAIDGAGSFPTALTTLGRSLYFLAQDSPDRWRLWGHRPPSGTTELLSPVNVGAPHLGSRSLTKSNSRLFYFAESSDRYVPWASDGTAAGTRSLLSAANDASFSSVSWPVAVADRYYFFGQQSASDDVQLWRSDGSPGGTIPLSGFSAANPTKVLGAFSVGGRLLFVVENDQSGAVGLWTVVDSQPRRLTDLARASDGSVLGDPIAMDGIIYFAASDAAHGIELWRTDGSGAGTTRLVDLFPGALNSAPAELRVANHRLYFSATTPDAGRELWASDGTAEGTKRVKDIFTGVTGSDPSGLTEINGLLFFSAGESHLGRELWRSDGTEAGTVPLLDVAPGNLSSNPRNFILADARIYFSASLPGEDPSLWSIAAPSASEIMCVGDCDSSRTVTIDELILGINASLELTSIAECPEFDVNDDQIISVDELIAAVSAALSGCSAE